MDDDIKFHQTWHLHQLPTFYQQFLFIFYSVYKNKPRGVSVRDLIKFIKKNYYLDGDICPQVTTVLIQAVDQGVIKEHRDKYHLVGPIASVQDTAPDSPERRNELESIYGVFNYNATRGRSGSRSKTKETFGERNRQNSEDILKMDLPTIDHTDKRSGSREKCFSAGQALEKTNLADVLQSEVSESKISDKDSKPTPSRFVPNITVLSKIKQYFQTSVCKCQSRNASKSKSNTKSSLSSPSTQTNSSRTTMKIAIPNSKHSKNSKDISLKSSHDNNCQGFLSTHSKSERPKECKSDLQNSKLPKMGDSSQGISLQATRSKTPTQYTKIPSQKSSDFQSSASKYSDANNKSVLSFIPIISTFQHYLGCNECPATSGKSKLSPSIRTLRSRVVRNHCSSPQKQQYKRKKSSKRSNVKFRTMRRDRCSGQCCGLQRKDSNYKMCKARISRPTTVTSGRPCTRNTYAARPRSMGMRGFSEYGSKAGSLGKSNISWKTNRLTNKKRKRKNSGGLGKKCRFKKSTLKSRDSYYGESYWDDFCCS